MTSTLVLSKQNQHFYQYVEHLNSSSLILKERLRSIEMMLRQTGLDVVAAKAQALKLLLGFVQRDAFIQSFSDVFICLAVGLALCALLVAFLKPPKGPVSLDMIE